MARFADRFAVRRLKERSDCLIRPARQRVPEFDCPTAVLS
jgi:hypothetical protein